MAVRYIEDMGHWTWAEGLLTDGLPMRLYLAEHEGKLWSASLSDSVHSSTKDEFKWRLGKDCEWKQSRDSDTLQNAVEQVNEYFAGKRLIFDLPLALRGTSFQVRVWEELLRSLLASGATTAMSPRRWGNRVQFGQWAMQTGEITCRFSCLATGCWRPAESGAVLRVALD